MKQILGTILAFAVIIGVVKSFFSSILLGIASIFIPPIAIFMLFFS